MNSLKQKMTTFHWLSISWILISIVFSACGVETSIETHRVERAVLGGVRSGIPGQDFPTLSAVPRTDFSCQGLAPGYYADQDFGCQVFHICHTDRRKDSFLCPNGTIFHQQNLVCDWWYNVDCSNSAQHFSANEGLAKNFGPPSRSQTFNRHSQRVNEQPRTTASPRSRPTQRTTTPRSFTTSLVTKPLPGQFAQDINIQSTNPQNNFQGDILRGNFGVPLRGVGHFELPRTTQNEVAPNRNIISPISGISDRFATKRPFHQSRAPGTGVSLPLSRNNLSFNRQVVINNRPITTARPISRITQSPQTRRPFTPRTTENIDKNTFSQTIPLRGLPLPGQFDFPNVPKRNDQQSNFFRVTTARPQVRTTSRITTASRALSRGQQRITPASLIRPPSFAQINNNIRGNNLITSNVVGQPLPTVTSQPFNRVNTRRPNLRVSSFGRPLSAVTTTVRPTLTIGNTNSRTSGTFNNIQTGGRGTPSRFGVNLNTNNFGSNTLKNTQPNIPSDRLRSNINRGSIKFRTSNRNLARINAISNGRTTVRPFSRVSFPITISREFDDDPFDDDRFDDGPFDDDRFDDGPFDDDRFDDGPFDDDRFDDDRFDDGPFDDDRFDDGPFDDDRFDDGPFDDDRFDDDRFDDDRFDDGPFDDDRFDDGPFDDDRFDDDRFDDDRFDDDRFDDDRFDDDRFDFDDNRLSQFSNGVRFNFGRIARGSRIRGFSGGPNQGVDSQPAQRSFVQAPSEIQLPPPPI